MLLRSERQRTRDYEDVNENENENAMLWWYAFRWFVVDLKKESFLNTQTDSSATVDELGTMMMMMTMAAAVGDVEDDNEPMMTKTGPFLFRFDFHACFYCLSYQFCLWSVFDVHVMKYSL